MYKRLFVNKLERTYGTYFHVYIGMFACSFCIYVLKRTPSAAKSEQQNILLENDLFTEWSWRQSYLYRNRVQLVVK